MKGLQSRRPRYKVFAGKDVTRAFATMSLKAEECNKNNFDDFEAVHYKTLREWTVKCAMFSDTQIADWNANNQ